MKTATEFDFDTATGHPTQLDPRIFCPRKLFADDSMINTLFLPELREMLAENNAGEMREFCTAMHPARTAEFMAGLESEETWAVLRHTDLQTRAEIFSYFDRDKQHEILESQDRKELAEMIAEFAADDRVDMLLDLEPDLLKDLLDRLPVDERRDFLRLSQYPEGTAGAVMTTEVAKLSETLTIEKALHEIGRQSEDYETIYYLYIVDDNDHLRGLVSARQLLAGMRDPNRTLAHLMETDLIVCSPMEDQEDVANKVAQMDLLAIPVVDAERRMLGIITHDDVIDVVRREATEDAHLSAAVAPLEETYLKTSIFTLSWKRGIWLCLLFFFALATALALRAYHIQLAKWEWLVLFIPLVISSGGNSGTQSATLIITALARGHITLKDWFQVVMREISMGFLLGSGLALMGYITCLFFPDVATMRATFVVPITLLLVVISGTLTGSILPLIFERLGWDPAIMSNPFVAGIVDILGVVIYLNVAIWLL